MRAIVLIGVLVSAVTSPAAEPDPVWVLYRPAIGRLGDSSLE
jgi:hypothetical protein